MKNPKWASSIQNPRSEYQWHGAMSLEVRVWKEGAVWAGYFEINIRRPCSELVKSRRFYSEASEAALRRELKRRARATARTLGWPRLSLHE
jgi:hypothetical protein